MSTRDLHNVITFQRILSPATSTGAVAINSAVVDRARVHAVEIVVTKGANTATTGTLKVDVRSGSTNTASDHISATTSEVLGTNPKTMTATTAGIHTAGYIGADRYVSAQLTQGAATGNYSAVALKGPAKR